MKVISNFQLAEMFHRVPNVILFFFPRFLSQTFMFHRAVGKGGDYLFNSSLSLPPASSTCTTFTSSFPPLPSTNF